MLPTINDQWWLHLLLPIAGDAAQSSIKYQLLCLYGIPPITHSSALMDSPFRNQQRLNACGFLNCTQEEMNLVNINVDQHTATATRRNHTRAYRGILDAFQLVGFRIGTNRDLLLTPRISHQQHPEPYVHI